MLERLMKGMVLNYQQHWIIDNIPVTWCYKNMEDQEFCSRGFPIGCYVTKDGQASELCNIRHLINDTFYVFNHLDFEITYHSRQDKAEGRTFTSRIIAAKVQVNRSVQFSLSSNFILKFFFVV
jgi:transmembrane 9 superfamily protein 2/4